MARYIEAEKLRKELLAKKERMEKYDIDAHYRAGLFFAIWLLDRQPTAEVVPFDFYERCVQAEIEKRFKYELGDYVEVVRCKDCKYSSIEGKETYYRYCYPLETPVIDDFYCAYGECEDENKSEKIRQSMEAH